MSQKQAKSDMAFLTASWEWAATMGSDFGCGVQITLTPTERKGVFRLRARAVDVVDGTVAGIRVQAEGLFPTAQHQTLEGAIFGLMLKISSLLEEGTPLDEATNSLPTP